MMFSPKKKKKITFQDLGASNLFYIQYLFCYELEQQQQKKSTDVFFFSFMHV